MKIKPHIGLVIIIIIAISVIVFLYHALTRPEANATTTIKTNSTSKVPGNTEDGVTFTIGGDAMLGRAIAWKFNNDVTQAFKELGENYFSGVDVGIINLEGPISQTDFKSNPTPDNLIFNFPPQSIDALKYLGVNAVSSANNHSQNQGNQGLATTKQLLTASSISSIGSQTKFDEGNIKAFGKLSVIAVNLVGQDFDITDAIKSEKAKGQTVLIFPHWGTEYQTTHSSIQSKYAYSWADSGADIIIGSHPHVVQDAEVYNGKPIFYSLGNLVFDQNFSSETMHGLIISGEITKAQIKLTLKPTTIKNYQVKLSEGDEKENVISKFKKDLANFSWQGDAVIIKQ